MKYEVKMLCRFMNFFEAVIEESLEDLSAFTVNLKRREERIVMSMSVECKTRSAGNCRTIWSLCGAGF